MPSLKLVPRPGKRGTVLYATGRMGGRYVNRTTGYGPSQRAKAKSRLKEIERQLSLSIERERAASALIPDAYTLYERRPSRPGVSTINYVHPFVLAHPRFRVREIKPSHVLAHVRTTGRAPSSVRREIAAIQGFLNFAREAEDLPTFRIRKPASPPPKQSIYTEAQRNLMLATCATMFPWFVPHMTTLFYTGMRRSELTNLRWGGIERHSPAASDEGEPSEPFTFICVSSRKGRTGSVIIRRIPVHSVLQPILTSLRATHPCTPSDFVFLSSTGRPITSPETITHTWKRVAKACDLPNLTPHDARRTFASQLLANNIGDLRITDLLGHIDTKMLPTYAVIDDDLRSSAVSSLR